MSFLAPLFLFGALAIALPIVFHLVRRSSKENIPFSSLMFLHPTPPRVTRRNRLEHIFLLLLRCLVIGLLAIGFARPFLQKPMSFNPPSERGRRIILLVDTSASMRREGVWPAALAKAEELLNSVSTADQVAVLTFDRQVHSLVSFDQWASIGQSERAALTAGRLREVKPTWANTHVGNAMIAAAEAFTEADKQDQNLGPRRIVLISDLQEGSRLDGLQGYDWPRGIEVQLERIQTERPTNAGLQWVMDADDSAKVDADASSRIRVSNSPNARREQFQLRWEGVSGTTPVDIYVPPGQSRIVQAPTLPPGATGEHLVLRGDDDDFDNAAYIVQPKAEQVTVLFLGDESEKDPTQPFYYLKRGFQQTRRQVVHLSAHPASAALPPDELNSARLLIATDRLPENQVNAVQTFLDNGGTALFIMKNTAMAETIGRCAGTGALTAKDIVATNYAMFGLIDFEHPLFAAFADPRYNDFTKIHFWKYRRFETGNLPGARLLARFDNGDAAFVEIPRGKGRLLVLTSGWQPADSQLALSSKFVPLLYAMLDLAGGIRAQVAQFHVGDPVDLASALVSTVAQSIAVVKPDGQQIKLEPGEMRFSQTDIPGIYSVIAGGTPIRFAVNLDATESRTAPLSIDELERLGIPLKPREIELAKQIEQRRVLQNAELENQQKLWRWLTVAALVLLLMETWVAGWLTRRTTMPAEGTT